MRLRNQHTNAPVQHSLLFYGPNVDFLLIVSERAHGRVSAVLARHQVLADVVGPVVELGL